MSVRMKLITTLIKLGIAGVAGAVLFAIIFSAIKNPVPGETHNYTAEFTDVSGLHENGDVRSKGVRIGKVLSIELHHRDGKAIADVELSLEEPHQLVEETVLAVKYQNLTGIRYIDVQQPAEPGNPVDHLGIDSTKPSFDITELFNGLQPVLTTLSTDEINAFMQNAITLLQGDGTGLTPMLDDVQKLADLAADRQQVISTLVGNVARIADSMGGRSPQVVAFMESMSVPIGQAMTVLTEFEKTSVYGPEFLTPVHRLITQLGLNRDFNVDELLTSVFTSVPAAVDALRLLPPALAGLQLPQMSQAADAMNCSSGIAQLPTDVEVLLNGSEVVLCEGQ